MSIEVNQNDLNRITIKLNNIATQDFHDVLDMAGYYIEVDAQTNAPVDTGRLRKSIAHEATTNELTVYANTEYAPWKNMRRVNRAKSVKAKFVWSMEHF